MPTGEADCMDHSDETEISGTICYASPHTFYCDEKSGKTGFFSCGDGEIVAIHAEVPFQTILSLYQYCNNLRNINYMCEAWSVEHAWTLPSGMCEFETDYDDPRYDIRTSNVSSQETCTYLLRCALTNGFERDCPCGRNSSCKERMISLCPDSTMILYPRAGFIRPYILLFYAAQDAYPGKVPEKIVVSGSIKCRGFRAEAPRTRPAIYLNYNYPFVNTLDRDSSFCRSTVERNTSSLVKFYPTDCWNNSHTFSGLRYYSADVCWKSHACISPYRINDGYYDCELVEDENRSISVNSCSKIQRHRFQCSLIQPLCLLPWALVNGRTECENKFDHYIFGNGTLLRDMPCNHRNDIGCVFLRTYIEQSSMNNTNRYEDAHLTKRVTHHAYCNSHWDTHPPVDEQSTFCKEWVCPEGSFRCRSNQCIPLKWVCDGEWDCSDASDEQAVFIYNHVWDRNQDVQNLWQIIEICTSKYATQPFSDICNVSTEFPCLLANVTNPLDIYKNRPCIGLALIGDGIQHCYGGLDERNTATGCGDRMKGFDFHCNRSLECISYAVLCVQRCLNRGDDRGLCFHTSHNDSCNGISDVKCFDGRCIPNARCNKTNDCAHGEDEYWCPFNGDRLGYRLDKHQQQKQQPRKINWLSFPLEINKTLLPSDKLERVIRAEKRSIAYRYDLSGAFVCNRGLGVRLDSEIRCLCSGTYYGDRCQYFSDRITVITHLNLTHTGYEKPTKDNILIKVVAFFLFKNDEIIDHHEFIVTVALELIDYTKHKFQLVYSRSDIFLKHKKQRYFNRTDIVNNHPYSVRFEAFEMKPNITKPLAAWNYPIYFDYLPSFRLASYLRFPETFLNATHHSCVNITCNSNSICIPFFTSHKWSYTCSCKSTFYGPDCQLFDRQCSTYCSSESICRPSGHLQLADNKQPLCICQHNHFGPRCYLKYDECQSGPCRNNGTCYHTFDSSGTHPFFCMCHEHFHGKSCEHEKSSINIQLVITSLPKDTLASVIQYYDVDNVTFELIFRHQQLFTGIPTDIHYSHAQIEAPLLSILKVYASFTSANHYILYIQPNMSMVNITSTPRYCPHATSLFKTSKNIKTM